MPEAHGADPGGLIDPASFPCKSADLNTETIASGGDQLASMGTNLKSKVEAVETAWTPIAEPYRAPEQDSVYALMTPAVDAAGDVSSRFTSAQGHIDTYASSLSTIKTTLSDLETRAADFRTEALAGYKKYVDKSGKVPEMSLSYNKPNVLVDCTWEEHPPAVEQNDALLAEYNAVLESISTAATTCANSISAPGAAAGAVDPRSATSRWWECAPPAIGVVPVGAPSSWNRTWKAPWARKTARATWPRDCLTPTSTADSGVTRVAIARISSACGAAPPPRVWDSAASNVATEDTAAARTSRSCRAFTLSA